jgi:hypothetical protein
MINKLKINEVKERFIELWEIKTFKFAIIIHLIYFVLSILLFLLFLRNQNDFMIFYKAGELISSDITNLYNEAQYIINGQPWNFRYFPLSAFLFVPFTFMDLTTAFIVFTIFNLILNILICLVLYKIIKLVLKEKLELNENKVVTYISIFLLSAPHIFNYFLGQINLYITFLILISLYVFLKYEGIKWQLVGSLILGISVLIKPITICIIPFLLIINYDRDSKKFIYDLKKSGIRIMGALLPLSLNLIVFLVYPVLWEGFLNANFSGNAPIILNFSFSITKLITNFYLFYQIPFDQLFIFILVVCIIGSWGFVIFVIGRFKGESIVYGYLLGILIMLLVYFDSWNHHLLILTPILIIVMFQLQKDSETTRKYIKPNILFLSFLDLPFMGIWYLTQDFFPFNFAITISLLLVLYGISKKSLFLKERD